MPSLIVNYGLIWRVADICRISFSHYKFSLWNLGEIWEHWWKKLLPNKSCTFKPGVIISRFFCPCQSLSSLLLCLCFVKRKDVNLFFKIIIFHWWSLGFWNLRFLAKKDIVQGMVSTSTFQLSYPTLVFLVFDEFDIQLFNGCWRAKDNVFSVFNRLHAHMMVYCSLTL